MPRRLDALTASVDRSFGRPRIASGGCAGSPCPIRDHTSERSRRTALPENQGLGQPGFRQPPRGNRDGNPDLAPFTRVAGQEVASGGAGSRPASAYPPCWHGC